MEWRQQTSMDYDSAFSEAQRWIEAVTKKRFGSCNFRSSLENGVLLCDLINNIRPGIIKKLNRLSTPIAGLDNLNLFLKGCGKLGLNQAQLFDPGDLQDLSTRVTVKRQESSRRLKNVLITLYWLGRKALADPFYNGPYLNLKAFEGLLGTALYKALEDCTSLQGSAPKGSCSDSWYSEKEELLTLLAGHKREDSLDSLDSLDSRTYSTSPDATLKANSEGCGSDPEADLSFMMSESKEYRRSLVVTPKVPAQFNQFLPTKDKPSGYVPAPLRKKRVDRNEENRQSWGAPLYTDEDGNFSRSKSISDITEQINLSNMTRELRFEELRKMREQMKESEEKWQDDLTRWKNKRRSVTSDIVKKKEERDEIEQITSDSRFRRSKTFSEMQDDRESRGRHRNSFNFSSDEVFEDPVPKTRTLPPRSYTIDTPYAPTDKASVPSVPSLKEEEPVAGTPALDDTDLPAKRERTSFTQRNVTNSVIKSQTTTRSLLDDPVPAISSSNTSQIKPTSLIKPTSFSKPSATSVSETSTTSTVLESSKSISSTKPVENSSVPVASLYKPRSVETKQPDQVPVPLPRSYPRSDSARLTSVVTPRPFGMQSNRIASLPRTFTVDDSQKRMNGDNIRKPTVPSRYAQFAAEDENLSQGSPAQSSNEEEEEEKSAAHTHSSVPLVNRVSPLSKTYSPHSSPDKEDYSDMRISLNQRPNSSQDFGFQTNWDSTGVRVKSVVPGSPAELGQLKVGDEILMVNGHKVADMSYNEWKNRMDEALKQGALLMDVRSHGRNNWGRDQPSLPFKSHKTVNLTSLDPLGSPESHLSANLDFTSQAKDTVVKTVNVSSQPSNNYGSNGINGGLRKESDAVNYKESESISLKNLKRRSEFFEQGSAGLSVSSLVYLCGGSDTAIPNLPSPSITTSSIRSSWDQEDERKRQEKWQKEQERLLQEKYKKDQEKLEEEWKKAQQEFARNNKSETMQESARLQEEEKRRREQERQRLEEERRKREEQQRLEEERKKREEEERLRQETERKRREEERRQQEEQRRLREQDKVNSFGSTNAYRNLSYSHRSLSKSTPELDEVAKPDIKGVYGRHRGLAGWLLEEELRRKKNPQVQSQLAASELELERRSILNAMKYSNPERAVSGGLGEVGRDYKKEPQSQAELERQQILQEMKKKTSINTDKSWIRQQSLFSNTQKESVNLPMRRGESLDNLDVPRSSWRSSWAPSSTSSVPDYSRPYSAFSNSSTYNSGRPGSVALHTSQPVNSLRQSISQESQAPSRNRSVSGRKICSYCNTPLGKGAAMIIESLGLCYHLTCFKCINCRSELGGSEAGAEVRIRHQQLYCNTCYTRLKTGQPTAM
ncbi:LIM domain only protein 7 isoform X12 [Paramisgurnus dabryanus]|uniref:LIM domain only protein 7 isoform X12 n=1 Tax=Paramisgurnus dabryanus TaxID=90735 RepID=UPI0031F396E1